MFSLRRAEVRVATSDGIEQTIVMGRGAVRVSSRELLLEMEMSRAQRSEHSATVGRKKSTVADRLPENILMRLEEMRRG